MLRFPDLGSLQFMKIYHSNWLFPKTFYMNFLYYPTHTPKYFWSEFAENSTQEYTPIDYCLDKKKLIFKQLMNKFISSS